MATLKLKPKAGTPADRGRRDPADKPPRPPLRGVGAGVRRRPTLAEAQAQRDAQAKPPRPPAGPRDAARKSPAQPSDRRAPPRRAPMTPDPARNAPPTSRPNAAFDGPATSRRAQRPAPSDDTARQPPAAPPRARAATPADASLRLSKYLSELGLASRREADEWIPKGWVRVDGRVVAELGSRVLRGQQVTIDAKARHVQAQKVTVLINKPVGYVSGQAEDGYEPAWVLVKPANQWADDRSGIRFLPQHLRSLVPAGRLDIDSVGLLVLTQDGRVAKQLIGEHSPIEKEYLVRVASADGSRLSEQGLALLRHGLELDGQALREAQVEWVNDDQLRFVLREGKKRQIRRMCEAVGLQVLGLKRVRIGQVMLGDLPPGQWRYLRVDEGFA